MSESDDTRPLFLARQHSRSSSQIAILGSLSLSSTASVPPSPTQAIGNQSPRFSFEGLGGGLESPLYLSRSGSPEPMGGNAFASSSNSRRVSLGDGGAVFGHSRSSTENWSFTPLPPPATTLASSASSTSLAFKSTPPLLPQIDAGNPNFAQLIQQKRRQASAPYFASARSSSLFSPGAGFGISSINAVERTDYVGAWGGPRTVDDEGRRTRSRVASRVGSMSMSLTPMDGGEEGVTGMVMTPTTAEWRQLGGQLSELADIRARDEAKIGLPDDVPGVVPPYIHRSTNSSGANSLCTTSSSSSSISLTEMARSTNSFSSQINRPPVSPLPTSVSSPSIASIDLNASAPSPNYKVKSSFSYQSSRTGFSHSTSLSYDAKSIAVESPIAPNATFTPTHRLLSSESSIRPNLSRGSLSSKTGSPRPIPGTPTPSPFNDNIVESTSGTNTPSVEEEEQRLLTPVPLDRLSSMGPVDPRRYSAYTGLRSIDNFKIEGEVGKGAYGSVRRARELGHDGLPFGPELIIKYVIKQRILADCWKKHKLLGPIPIEVHVLDHLRRVPYTPRSNKRKQRLAGSGTGIKPFAMGERRDSAPSSVKEGMITGHPHICGMLDFFEDGEFYYLVMPQAGISSDEPSAPQGQDLFELVDANADGLTPPVIRSILSQIAEALYFLHEHGIVHRDIKDENVVLDHLGNIQLIDFGSAAYVKDGKKFDTFSGTLDFAAPEVLRGARYGGKETDVWALGVLGYVIIIGECPFWSPEEAMRGLYVGSRAELALRAKCRSSTTSSLSSASSLPLEDEDSGSGAIEDAVDLVMRCLEVVPVDRPSADEILGHKFIVGKDGWVGFKGWVEEDLETGL